MNCYQPAQTPLGYLLSDGECESCTACNCESQHRLQDKGYEHVHSKNEGVAVPGQISSHFWTEKNVYLNLKIKVFNKGTVSYLDSVERFHFSKTKGNENNSMKKFVLYAKLEKYIYVSLRPSTLTNYKYGSFLNVL